ncbi:hypothetical protein [Pollutibacter soli]|uniref:hypothetical protein n=1 Tax=Pollutibacter soli TaxID=3034157 RepID=UPI003013DE4E
MNKLFLALCFLLFANILPAQRIYYSDIEKDDYRQMNFEIIGKVGGNINIYKNYRNRNDIAVYFNDMKLKSKTKLEFMPDRVYNVDFVAYPDFYYMIYQYQKRNVMFCAMVKMNGEGKLMTDPVVLDTSQLPSTNESKVYTTVASDDKQKIMVFKINKKNEKSFLLTTLLYNNHLELQKKSNITMSGSAREDLFTDFLLDNDGDLVFGRCGRTGNRDYINNFDLVLKRANEDTLQYTNFPLTDKTLDEIKIKPDNTNKNIIFSSFYYKQKRGNIDGLYSVIWDKNDRKVLTDVTFPFGDTLRMDARSDNSSLKVAFNDYFIKQIIPTRDGGYAVLAELYYTTSRASGWSRYDYLYGYNSFMPYDYYYSPYGGLNNYYRGWDPYNRYGSATRHFAENIMIFYFNKAGNLVWSNAIRKTQFDDNTDMYLSYQLFNTGSEVRILFNQLERRERMLNSVTANASGEIKKDPTLRNLDKGYEFMPRFGKQVGLKEIVLPCMNRNYICFAKLDF